MELLSFNSLIQCEHDFISHEAPTGNLTHCSKERCQNVKTILELTRALPIHGVQMCKYSCAGGKSLEKQRLRVVDGDVGTIEDVGVYSIACW